MASMTYEIVDLDSGDVLAVYPTMEQARERAQAYIEEHEDIAEDIAIIEIGANGERIGDPVQALALRDASLSY